MSDVAVAYERMAEGAAGRWTLRRCLDADSAWWEAEAEDGQRLVRADLEELVALVRHLNGVEKMRVV